MKMSLDMLRLALRFACREMRGGLRGFYIFFCCIVLGVAAMAGVSGISTMIGEEFNAQGQVILGGDIRISMMQGEPTDEEYDFFTRHGRVANSIWMRSMARRVDDSRQTIIELKAIDQAYPLYGRLKTLPEGNYEALFTLKSGRYGVVVAPSLLEKLELKLGDLVEIGDRQFDIRAVVEDEPDLLSEGLQLGLRVFMAQEAVLGSSLMQAGSLAARTYKIALFDGDVTDFSTRLKQEFPQSQWNVRTSANAAPTLEVNIKRFLQFLTLIGLTALIVGGTGIAGAVHAYLERKREVIAIFKSLGASGHFVVMLYLCQIMIVSLMAVLVGLGFAALMPLVVMKILQQFLPMMGQAGFYPSSLLIGAGFALMITIGFALIPLARSCELNVTSLFRNWDGKAKRPVQLSYRLIAACILVATAGAAVLVGHDRRLGLVFIVSIAGIFLILKLLVLLIKFLAKRFSHQKSVVLRLASGNIYRPGSLTGAVVHALGLGLTLLVTLATIDGNLRNQLTTTVMEEAPTFFFLDVPALRGDEFRAFIKGQEPHARLNMMPILRARIVSLNGVAAEVAPIDEEGRWVLRGDRNVGFSATLPDEAILHRGDWWPQDYDGPPLVSFSAREAQRLRLNIDDTISVNVLGRIIEARIANLREVDWDTMKMNFVMIFSPNTFAGAPYSFLATLNMPADERREADLTTQLGRDFPAITVLPMRNMIENARNLTDQIGLGVRASASIVLLASILVLAGALSASNRNRSHDAVVLKILGATRRRLACAFVLEYTILGITTAIFAFVTGGLAGVVVARLRMNLSQATLLPETALVVLALALIFSVGLGLIGTWRILGQKPSRWLREL